MPSTQIRRCDRVTGAVELGPRSLALLRRMVACLEDIIDGPMPDPGKESEGENTETWPDDEQ